MTRRPGEKPVDTPGGKAAERLREFEAARGITEASKESDDATQEGLLPQSAGEAPKELISAKDADKKARVKTGAKKKPAKQSTQQKKRTAKQRSGPRGEGARFRRPKEK
jgi:hypothetical protein